MAQQQPAEVGTSVVVRRADGTVEEYGLVSYDARNPLRRWLVRRMLRRGDRLPKDATMNAGTVALAWQWMKGHK